MPLTRLTHRLRGHSQHASIHERPTSHGPETLIDVCHVTTPVSRCAGQQDPSSHWKCAATVANRSIDPVTNELSDCLRDAFTPSGGQSPPRHVSSLRLQIRPRRGRPPRRSSQFQASPGTARDRARDRGRRHPGSIGLERKIGKWVKVTHRSADTGRVITFWREGLQTTCPPRLSLRETFRPGARRAFFDSNHTRCARARSSPSIDHEEGIRVLDAASPASRPAGPDTR